MALELKVKQAIYRHFSAEGRAPSPEEIAREVDAEVPDVLRSFESLRAKRVLVIDGDGVSIRMAPPFSGVPTQHVVTVAKRRYFANCAWDALGIPAALHAPGIVESRCGQSDEPLRLSVGASGPEACDWVFHCAVPAVHWWDDIVFT